MIPTFPPTMMAPPTYGGASQCSAAYAFYCNAYPSAAPNGFSAECAATYASNSCHLFSMARIVASYLRYEQELPANRNSASMH